MFGIGPKVKPTAIKPLPGSSQGAAMKKAVRKKATPALDKYKIQKGLR